MNPTVVITTRNEEESISRLVEAFRRLGVPVLVVNDGSTDDTGLVARIAGAKVIETEGGLGIGPSLLLGWQTALADPACDCIIQLDAGNSHQVEDYPLLLHTLDGTMAYDMVIGSRFIPSALYLGVNGPWWRPYISRAMAAMCNLAHGSAYHDWTSGYRIFRREVVEYLLSRTYLARMHGWQIEVLAYASEHGFRIGEAPITYIAGESSFNARIAREALWVWWHLMTSVGWKGSKLYEEAA